MHIEKKKILVPNFLKYFFLQITFIHPACSFPHWFAVCCNITLNNVKRMYKKMSLDILTNFSANRNWFKMGPSLLKKINQNWLNTPIKSISICYTISLVLFCCRNLDKNIMKHFIGTHVRILLADFSFVTRINNKQAGTEWCQAQFILILFGGSMEMFFCITKFKLGGKNHWTNPFILVKRKKFYCLIY